MATAQTNLSTESAAGKNSDIDALKDQISTLRSDVKALTELMGEVGKARGTEAREKAEAKVHELRGRGEDALHEAGRRLTELEAETAGHIRTSPFQAIGVAAAVGFLIGYLGRK
ncbi:hypothetical protein AL036_17310 [Salipiger aestuarii]|uniref:ElaB/YqjD/DUF883 family membrane-anchored ribosome-binding protein n=1 Tax=Salipiger aestuarii TaxID=568098 RepID=A0A327XQE5_9RHOB|nr:DUF883 family protein [Salipiger aestuarii]EIE52856.1 hypothetical protein C357_01465 [Citreicella sp. 357]KAA8605770.1 hypothetical protein AL036_17310 [Salipiger aestuarii]KAA8608267.1 hypothetical protein AL037_17205 [Salipiger aestuarii]KAB2540552.1 hypothetical protein AL035_16930 [Salipiger aestuarii]RAK11020.1 ElaB/YqjD/DUF883 family membrane-anchored ribosome-binding protein [Salipiger aestuarii]